MSEATPERKAFDYVVGELGANEIYEQAQKANKRHADNAAELIVKRKRRRELEQMLHDREMVIAEDIHSQNKDQSQAARDRLLKVAINNDGDIRETKEELATLAWEIDTLEFASELASQDIKIAVARMQELGGFLQYLAVIKQAQLTRQHITRQGPWST